MIEYFINSQGVIRAFYVENGKVRTTITYNGNVIVNPTLEQFIASGWIPYQP